MTYHGGHPTKIIQQVAHGGEVAWDRYWVQCDGCSQMLAYDVPIFSPRPHGRHWCPICSKRPDLLSKSAREGT